MLISFEQQDPRTRYKSRIIDAITHRTDHAGNSIYLKTYMYVIVNRLRDLDYW